MPLSTAEQAELALRTTGAFYFDPRGLPSLNDAGRTEIRVRLEESQAVATGAALKVTDHASLVACLKSEALKLEASLPEREETPETQDAVKKAAASLRYKAEHIPEGHDGDGLASDSSPSGVLPFVCAVEQHVGKAYNEAFVLAPVRPLIKYVTYITPDIHNKMGDFNVSGKARINTKPVQVDLFIRREAKILAHDLWQLAYVLHHELTCHAFQYATQITANGHSNAPMGCPWTEGWMDAAAFALAKAWASCGDCSICFAFGGSAAISTMNKMHQARYPDPASTDPARKLPPGLSENEAYLRFHARQAFDALTAALTVVCERTEAEAMAVKFSLRLNAHESVNYTTLRRVCARLQSTLLNGIRSRIAEKAARACLDFAATGDLARLEQALALAGGTVPLS